PCGFSSPPEPRDAEPTWVSQAVHHPVARKGRVDGPQRGSGDGYGRLQWGEFYRLLGGSMRIGNKLSGAMFWAVLATASATLSADAGAAERVQPVPLGGAIAEQVGDRYFGVYVPTMYGGELTIRATSGTVSKLTGPDGLERQNGQEVGRNQQGWYSFMVTGATTPYTVETTFIQVGQSNRRPWNFYYWPT